MVSSSSSFSTSPMGQAPTHPHDERVEWLIIIRKKGQPIVYHVELHNRMTGTAVMHAIHRAYKETNTKVPWYHSRPQLEEAVISSFTMNADTEAQDYPHAVIIKSSEPLPELTKAFHNPALLNSSGTALLRDIEHINVALGRNKIDSHYHGILIKTEASHWLIVSGVLVLIAMSVVIGFSVGYFTGNGQLGVAAGAATVAVLTFVQGCLVFLR